MFYDAECLWCRTGARLGAALLRFYGYQALPLQTPGIARCLGISDDALRAEMHILTIEGRRLAGADAYIEIARARVWTRPFAWLGSLPMVLPILRRIYAWVAANRPCDGGTCRLSPERSRWRWSIGSLRLRVFAHSLRLCRLARRSPVSALPFKAWIAWQKLLALLGRKVRRVDLAQTPKPRRHKTKRVFFDLP